MPRNITSIYIDDTSIKLMVTRGKRVSKLGDVPLDTSLMNTDTDDKHNELVTKIQHLIKTNKIGTRKVIVGISGLQCISRPVVLPQLPKTMLEEAFLREARRVFPVPPEQLHISWQIISESEGNMKAFMIAVPRHIADPLLSALDQVGLKPYLMDIKPLALTRLVKEPTAIIVDVQATEFDMVIMSDGIPQPIRTISLPQETTSLLDKMVIVKDELRRTVQFFNSNNHENPITADTTVYVSGELADEPDVYEALSQETGYRVMPLMSPLKCLKQLDTSHYLANVGLSLKELPKESGSVLPNINTLPVSYLPQQVNLNRVMAVPVAVVAIGLVILLAMTIQNASDTISNSKSKLDATEIMIEAKQTQKKELSSSIEAVKSQIAGIEAVRDGYIDTYDSFGEIGDQIDNDLLATVNEMVPGLVIRSISHSGVSIYLQGWSDSEQEVMEYVRKLQDTGRFREITISNLSRNSSANVTSFMNFSLSLNIN